MGSYKAKVGDSVELIVPAGGQVRVGEVGRVIQIDAGYSSVNYIVDFPSQTNFVIQSRHFTVYAVSEGKNKVAFDSVIIEDQKRQQILEALEQINHQELIFIKWGFGKTFEKGRGISMLFYGPPGTGKTLMAQAIADKLNYELKVIATAEIESSEPGQAERNIRAHFTGHNGKKTVLLFDECDSLIYDRATVGAIMGAQVNEMLSSLEQFEGITIFTTNRLGVLDEAVNRRLSLKLEFGLPSFEQRIDIWKRMFPQEAPLDKDVSWDKLAKVEIAGGYIKNAVLRAARMAACAPIPDGQKTIKSQHLVKALKQEVEAMIEFDEAKKNNGPRIGFPGMGVNRRVDVARDGGRMKKQIIDMDTLELEVEGEDAKT